MSRRLPLLVALVTTVVGLAARPAAAAAAPNDPEFPSQWGLPDIKAPDAWAKGKGAGIKVAIVSTGIAHHPDLVSKTDSGFDGSGGDPTVDTGGRGTHLAGTVGAATNNNLGIAGVAPDARLLPFKAFDTDTSVQAVRFETALQAVLSARPQVALVDVPDSFPTAERDGLRSSLKSLGDAGISVVLGAQSFVGLTDLPVLAVAASTSSGGQASGTAGVDGKGVAAPGAGIHSTTATPALLPGGEPTYGYGDDSGTREAAAHAAGAVAILRGLGASASQAADLLRTTARKSGNASLGAGIINVAAAVDTYRSTPPPAPSTTSTTKKGTAAGPPKPGTGAPSPPFHPSAPGPPALAGDAFEPGAGEAPVTPPGLDQLSDAPPEAGLTTTTTGTHDRPLALLAVGFGLLCGVGTGLSITLRRLAGSPI